MPVERMFPKFLPIMALGALTVLAGCGRSDPAVGDCGPVRERYVLGGQLDETIEHFSTYDLETRYRIYMCSNQGILPHRGLHTLFAEGGEEAANFLARKLEGSNYDLTIYNIVVVFATMQTMRTFDATTDPVLMELIERKVALLEGAHREWADKYLQTIRNGPGSTLPVPAN